MTEKKQVENLEDCKKVLEALEEENRHLRQAAGVFGKLAERLNVTLREERRRQAERRHEPRPTADRRHTNSGEAARANQDEWNSLG